MESIIPARGLSRFKLLRPLLVHNFRLLWGGSILSFVGGQLTLVAFPWLVLKLTGDPLVMGTVIAVSSVPRAIFMIVGGAATDRFSPRKVMLWTNWLRTALMFSLAAVVYLHWIQIWMVFVVALTFGVIDAFYWPSSFAILPRLLETDMLPAGNSLMQGMGQLSMMMGPALAGLIISLFSHGSNTTAADLPGIAVVFLTDGTGYIVSSIALMFIAIAPTAMETGREPFTLGAIGRSIALGVGTIWRDPPVRLVTAAFSIFSLFFRGPYVVGIPVLCNARFTHGALAYGMIGSAFGVGSLLGLVLAGTLPRPAQSHYGPLLLLDFLVIGSGFFVYAWTPKVEWAMLAAALGGVTDGYIGILLISWIQLHVNTDMLGRVMGMIMFFNTGVTPVSAAIAGALISISLNGVFIGAGAILVGLTLLGAAFPTTRSMGMSNPDRQG